MPRYFFHVQDGQDIRDNEGTELPSLKAARVAAVQVAGRLLSEHADEVWTSSDWQMDVTDHTGLLLFTLMFSATMAPAARGGGRVMSGR